MRDDVISSLSVVELNEFGVETGITYVISYKDETFTAIENRIKQQLEKGLTYEGQAGDWVKVWSKLDVSSLSVISQ